MQNGIRAPNIAIMNPDSVEAVQTQRDIVKNLTRHKIHITHVQETHITQSKRYRPGNYRIIATASSKGETTGVEKGGAAITMHGCTQNQITKITTTSSRVLRVTMGHAESKMPIRALSTYAPHNVHAQAESRQRWEDFEETWPRHSNDKW